MVRNKTLRGVAVAAMLTLVASCSGAGDTTPTIPLEPTTTQQTTPPTTQPPLSQRLKDILDSLPQGKAAGSGDGIRSQLDTGSATYTMADFLTFAMTDIDTFWTGVFKAAGRQEPFVNVAYPGPGESVSLLCSTTRQSEPDDAVYCFWDDKIVITQEVAVQVWEGTIKANGNTDTTVSHAAGDFSVAYVVAHEYAHSLQSELGILQTVANPVRTYPVLKTELHADCWAGVWANSAYYRGILEAGDIEEGIRTAQDVGDYDYDKADHHGTPAQRAAAFMVGYSSGKPQDCWPFLSN